MRFTPLPAHVPQRPRNLHFRPRQMRIGGRFDNRLGEMTGENGRKKGAGQSAGRRSIAGGNKAGPGYGTTGKAAGGI